MSRFTFSKKERLTSLKAIEGLFKNGSAFHTKFLKIFYALGERKENSPCRILFSVPKKNFKRAVDRNRIRRRVREAYRLNKHVLYAGIPKEKTLQMIFLYTAKEIHEYENILPEILKAVQTLLAKTSSSDKS